MIPVRAGGAAALNISGDTHHRAAEVICMKQKRERSPWRWLLLIPIQLVIGALTYYAGVRLDLAIFSGGEGQGHGMPIFSILFLIIVAVVTVIVIIVAIVGLIVSLVRRSRRRREEAARPAAAAPWPGSVYSGQAYPMPGQGYNAPDQPSERR